MIVTLKSHSPAPPYGYWAGPQIAAQDMESRGFFAWFVPSSDQFKQGQRANKTAGFSSRNLFDCPLYVIDNASDEWPDFYCLTLGQARLDAAKHFAHYRIVQLLPIVDLGKLDTNRLPDTPYDEFWFDGHIAQKDGAVTQEHLEWEKQWSRDAK